MNAVQSLLCGAAFGLMTVTVTGCPVGPWGGCPDLEPVDSELVSGTYLIEGDREYGILGLELGIDGEVVTDLYLEGGEMSLTWWDDDGAEMVMTFSVGERTGFEGY